MSVNIIIAEYNLWLDNLISSTTALSAVLESPSDKDNAEILQCHLDYMIVDAQELEKFRPSSDKKMAYDFSSALRPLATAKRLSARTQNILAAKKSITLKGANMFLISEVVSKKNERSTMPQLVKEENIQRNNLPTQSNEKIIMYQEPERDKYEVKEEIIDIEEDDLYTNSVHESATSNTQSKPSSSEIEKKEYICGYCKKKFYCEKRRKLHYNSHKREKIYSCTKCSGRTYTTWSVALNHIRKKHNSGVVRSAQLITSISK